MKKKNWSGKFCSCVKVFGNFRSEILNFEIREKVGKYIDKNAKMKEQQSEIVINLKSSKLKMIEF